MPKPKIDAEVLDAVQEIINARAEKARAELDGFIKENEMESVSDEQKQAQIAATTGLLFDSVELEFSDLANFATNVAEGVMLESTDELTEVIQEFAKAAMHGADSPEATLHAHRAIELLTESLKKALEVEFFTAFGFAIATTEYLQQKETA